MEDKMFYARIIVFIPNPHQRPIVSCSVENEQSCRFYSRYSTALMAAFQEHLEFEYNITVGG